MRYRYLTTVFTVYSGNIVTNSDNSAWFTFGECEGTVYYYCLWSGTLSSGARRFTYYWDLSSTSNTIGLEIDPSDYLYLTFQ